jgi:hypothetical protein
MIRQLATDLAAAGELIEALDRALVKRRKARRDADQDPIIAWLAAKLGAAWIAEGAAFLKRLATLAPLFEGARAREAGPTVEQWLPLLAEAQRETQGLKLDAVGTAHEAALSAGATEGLTSLGMNARFDLRNPRAVQWLDDRGAWLVTRIDETTRTNIRHIVTNAAASGMSYDETAELITAQYAQFAVKKPQLHIDTRAHLVAVTEVGEAYEHGNWIVAAEMEEAGVAIEKSWATMLDNRVSDGCRQNEAAGWIDFRQAFPSGHQRPLRFPGCRCALLTRPKVASMLAPAGKMPGGGAVPVAPVTPPATVVPVAPSVVPAGAVAPAPVPPVATARHPYADQLGVMGQYLPADMRAELPTSGRMGDLTRDALDRLAAIERERLINPTGSYATMASDKLTTALQSLQRRVSQLEHSKRQAALGTPGYTWDAQSEKWLTEFTARLDRAHREFVSRREWYADVRRLSSIVEGQRLGVPVIEQNEVARLIGKAGDAYVDAGLRPDRRGRYPYSPSLFRTSDLSGKPIRHYVTLPDGRICHPDELTDAVARKRVVVVGNVNVPARDWTQALDALAPEELEIPVAAPAVVASPAGSGPVVPPGSSPTPVPQVPQVAPIEAALRTEELAIHPNNFETLIAVREDANGNVVVTMRKGGGSDYVDVDPAVDGPLLKGSTCTHNHPTGWTFPATDPRREGNSFSPDDMRVAVGYDVAEIRAVSTTWRYRMLRPAGGWPTRAQLDYAVQEADAYVRNYTWAEIKAGTLTIPQAEARHWHAVWTRAAGKLGLTYIRERLEWIP